MTVRDAVDALAAIGREIEAAEAGLDVLRRERLAIVARVRAHFEDVAPRAVVHAGRVHLWSRLADEFHSFDLDQHASAPI